jgi:signal transduction histidine kinase
MLIALPLLALLALSVAALWTIQRSGFESPEYARLKTLENLRADTVTPVASLGPAWSEASRVGTLALGDDRNAPETAAEITEHLNRITSMRGMYTRSLQYWNTQDLDINVQQVLMATGSESGFFEVLDRSFVPAVRDRNTVAISAALDELEVAYNAESDALERVAAYVEGEKFAQESQVSSFVGDARRVLAAALALLVAMTLVLAVVVRRSIVRPIQSLAERAREVATTDLPAAVRDAEEGNTMPHVEPFRTERRGELADLGRSFNSVQESALSLAAEQARARRTVSENLINIARRNQSLLGRTLGFISELEQAERDPKALENLFRLDHLTTRMRRNAQSLLVLADAEPVRRFAPATPVGDVVRAALSEVENYAQVELGDLGVGYLQGSLVPEVAHLLAELIENATAFSPPTSRVTVVGRSVAEGHQIVIIDYGIGMSAEDLAVANARLSKVAQFEQDSNRMLGFHVVSRLAERHGIRVMVTATPGGTGTTAIVRLPRVIMEAAPERPATLSTTQSGNLRAVTPATSPAPAPAPAPVERPEWTPTALMTTERAPVTVDEIRTIVEGDPQVVAPQVVAPQAPAVSPEPAVAAALAPAEPQVAVGQPATVPMPSLAARPGAPAVKPEPLTSVSAELRAKLPSLGDALAATPIPAAGGTAVTSSGLTRRVRGAQLPDVGEVSQFGGLERSAQDVRATLSNLQRGVDLGRLSRPSLSEGDL